MKISEVIKELKTIQKTYGDLDCWYASDDEGNKHYPVNYTPSVAYLTGDKDLRYTKHSKARMICVVN